MGLLSSVKRTINLEERVGYPAQPGLIRPSVCPSVHAYRLGIERKMAQAQQIRSIIVNRESEILHKKVHLSESNTVNNMKLMILE